MTPQQVADQMLAGWTWAKRGKADDASQSSAWREGWKLAKYGAVALALSLSACAHGGQISASYDSYASPVSYSAGDRIAMDRLMNRVQGGVKTLR